MKVRRSAVCSRHSARERQIAQQFGDRRRSGACRMPTACGQTTGTSTYSPQTCRRLVAHFAERRVRAHAREGASIVFSVPLSGLAQAVQGLRSTARNSVSGGRFSMRAILLDRPPVVNIQGRYRPLLLIGVAVHPDDNPFSAVDRSLEAVRGLSAISRCGNPCSMAATIPPCRRCDRSSRRFAAPDRA